MYRCRVHTWKHTNKVYSVKGTEKQKIKLFYKLYFKRVVVVNPYCRPDASDKPPISKAKALIGYRVNSEPIKRAVLLNVT